MLFICLYHGELYSDLWKSYVYFRPAVMSYRTVFNVDFDNCLTPMEVCPFFLLVQRMGIPFKGSVWLQPGHRWLWPHHHWGGVFKSRLWGSTFITASVIFKGCFPWQAWSCYIKLLLYFTFLVLYFFILSYILTLQYFKLILSPT